MRSRQTTAGRNKARSIGMLGIGAIATVAAFVVGATTVSTTTPAAAKTTCKNTGNFNRWKREFRRTAASAGVSERTLRRAYDPISFDRSVIRRDRRQSFFSRTFIDFSSRLVSSNRLRTGPNKMRQRASMFRRAERQYGVPKEVITAFWALESDFGKGISKQYPILNSLATLAYDCRRPEMFQAELIAALKIVDDGYLPLNRLTGSWAGELGQTQFLPSHYYAHAVDANGDGVRDLKRTDADIIMSTAAFIKHLGWRPGEAWMKEVRVPRRMPWREADLGIYHPREQWARWGVRERDGSPLREDRKPAQLLLPMGRNGPAFLAYRNFEIFPKWNQSLNYAITVSYLATRFAGAPRYRKGNGEIEAFGYDEIKTVQTLLNRRGYDTGGIDGKHGRKSRAAVRAAQIDLGLPADSYPSRALVRALRRGS